MTNMYCQDDPRASWPPMYKLPSHFVPSSSIYLIYLTPCNHHPVLVPLRFREWEACCYGNICLHTQLLYCAWLCRAIIACMAHVPCSPAGLDSELQWWQMWSYTTVTTVLPTDRKSTPQWERSLESGPGNSTTKVRDLKELVAKQVSTRTEVVYVSEVITPKI